MAKRFEKNVYVVKRLKSYRDRLLLAITCTFNMRGEEKVSEGGRVVKNAGRGVARNEKME